MVLNFIIFIVSLLIGALIGVYFWQELRKKFNKVIPQKFKKIPFVLGLVGAMCSYCFADSIYTIITFFASL